MSVKDYEILNTISKQAPFKTYKVKQKYTDEIYVWNIFDYKQLNKADLEDLEERLERRKVSQHPHLLEFYDYFKQKDVNLLYIVSKFWSNGSLHNLVEMCLNDQKHFTENFLCRIVYQIAFSIKTMDYYEGEFQLTDIFFDDDFNVKLFNFDALNNGKLKRHKMFSLGALLYQICSLSYNNMKKDILDKDLQNFKYTYSKELMNFISSLLLDTGELQKNVDKILCHSTILLKSQQWNKTQCFVDNDKSSISSQTSSSCSGSCLEEKKHLETKLEKLKKKEVALQIKEQNLNEREHRLANKEKKIALMEKTVQEKLYRAELYLKRCRDSKSRNSNSDISEKYQPPNENLDSTYVSCVDSVIRPTSKKLNVNAIVKPAPFTRTLSEKRIRFKGYSPLKDIDSNKRRSIRSTKSDKNRDLEAASKSEWLTCSEDSASVDTNTTNRKCKQYFPKTIDAYENASNLKLESQSKTSKWTDENKKYAFQLLRLMNNDKENMNGEVKHTYL